MSRLDQQASSDFRFKTLGRDHLLPLSLKGRMFLLLSAVFAEETMEDPKVFLEPLGVGDPVEVESDSAEP